MSAQIAQESAPRILHLVPSMSADASTPGTLTVTNNQLIRSSFGPEQCLPSQVLAFRMAALDEQVIMSARILLYLWHRICPECGCVGTHDGDCTRDWRWPGRGLFGNAPPFRGTELLGLKLLAEAILARKTTETEDCHAPRAAGRHTPSCRTDAPPELQDADLEAAEEGAGSARRPLQVVRRPCTCWCLDAQLTRGTLAARRLAHAWPCASNL